MAVVRVHKDTPIQLVSNSPLATQVHTDFDGVLAQVLARIGAHGDLSQYGCLRPGEWISDAVMHQFIQYLNHGMPMSNIHEDLFGADDFQAEKGRSARHIDFGEVCILDPQISKTILDADTHQDYSKILRVLKASSNFRLLKRVLLPLNVTGKGMIAPDGAGCHWMLAELHLQFNHVHIFDWNSTAETKPLVQFGKMATPLFSLLRVLHERCDGLISTTAHYEVPRLKLHQRDVQKNNTDCGVWTLCALYFRALKGPDVSDPGNLFATMDLKLPTDATLLRLYMYMQLPVFAASTRPVPAHMLAHSTRRSANKILSKIIAHKCIPCSPETIRSSMTGHVPVVLHILGFDKDDMDSRLTKHATHDTLLYSSAYGARELKLKDVFTNANKQNKARVEEGVHPSRDIGGASAPTRLLQAILPADHPVLSAWTSACSCALDLSAPYKATLQEVQASDQSVDVDDADPRHIMIVTGNCSDLRDPEGPGNLRFSKVRQLVASHFDEYWSVVLVLSGKKRFRTCSPLTLACIDHGGRAIGTSRTGPRLADLPNINERVDIDAAFCEHGEWYDMQLQAGDMMVLPENWWHEVHPLQLNLTSHACALHQLTIVSVLTGRNRQHTFVDCHCVVPTQRGLRASNRKVPQR
jgi:hypothetical protein